jgi:hypothetical protein
MRNTSFRKARKALGRRALYLQRQERVAARSAKSPSAEIYLDIHSGPAGRFYSVNYCDGDGGFQSGPFDSIADALAEQVRLEEELGL